MVPTCIHNPRRHSLRFLPAVVTLFAAICSMLPHCIAQDIVRIEESWEMVVNDPDINSNGPQLSCTISPSGNLDGFYATFELNHRSTPSFSNGGLYLHVWNDEANAATRGFPSTRQLATSNEVVTWKQTMEIQNGQLQFEIVAGRSVTWGEFGDQGNLKAAVPYNQNNLNSYTPEVSVDNSGVTYASTCVKMLVLKRVRAVTSDGEVLTAELNRVVHQCNDDD